MELKELQKNWNQFGKIDPLWAILTVPGKRNRKWDVAEFFKTGEEEISRVMDYIGSLHLPLFRKRALDFGCGVGRLTQALCCHFEECCGIDIAPSMIEQAQEYNRYGSKCHYYLNEANNLSLFEDNSFDFIYSNIVLQHMKPEYSKNYIKEFLRVLAVDGVLIFQLPSEPAPIETLLAPGQSAIREPLPNSAFKAQLALEEPLTTVKAGSQVEIKVKVKNISNITWPSVGTADGKYQIRLGNHWLNQDGELLLNDDGRVSLPQDLKPMEEVGLNLIVTTPVKAGTYILELDLVQEIVSWFKDKGSETLKVVIQVEEGDRTINSDSAVSVPVMEMYGVPKDVILELITSSGGEIIDIQEDPCAGSYWLGFRYCVRKMRSHSQLQRLQADVERLQATITAMESSKFWKLRKAWFQLKRTMGLGRDE